MEIQYKRGIIEFNYSVIAHSSEEELKALFSTFYPFDCTRGHEMYLYDRITYVGISPLFRVLEKGEAIPTYDAIINRDASDVISIEMKEIK